MEVGMERDPWEGVRPYGLLSEGLLQVRRLIPAVLTEKKAIVTMWYQWLRGRLDVAAQWREREQGI